MKTSYFFGWLAAVVLLAAACSDDKPAPAPDPQTLELKTVIDGKYWSSTESFIYEKNGEEIVDRKSSLAALHWDTDRRSLLGVFYAAPAENADPFVKVGDVVHKGSVLCIIEAMKLMNEVVAEKDGVIEAVCAENGQVVEYGTELFRIKELSA